MNEVLQLVPSISVKSDHVLVVFKKWTSVRYCKQSDFQLFCLVVQLSLYVHAHCACALVQNCKQRLVIEKSGHRDSLLLATWKHVVPVVYWVESSLSALNVVKSDCLKEFPQVIVSDILFCHLRLGVGVNDLVSESSRWKVRPLWDVKKLFHVRSSHDTASQWPQSTQDSEQRALSTTIGPSNNCVHSSLNLKAHFLDETVSVGWNQRYTFKLNVILSLNQSALVHFVDWVKLGLLVLEPFASNNLSPDKFTFLQIL